VLFEADLRGTDVLSTVADRLEQADPPVSQYAVTLVEGVVSRRLRIDEVISTHAEGWTIDRMPAVDRNILRLAIFELLWRDDVDDPVVINEWVELAAELSTEDSPRFVNGMLGRLQLLKAELAR